MTAEVAVLNRSAVALAADSAVTISNSGGVSAVAKIFQNENKLFELSKTQPVGIMLYNATELFAIPWEIIIKDFRAKCGDIEQKHLYTWWDVFREHIIGHAKFCPSEMQQKEFLKGILTSEFRVVFSGFVDLAQPIIIPSKNLKSVEGQLASIFADVIKSRKRHYEASPYYVEFTDELAQEILSENTEEFESACKDAFSVLPLDIQNLEMLRELACSVICRARAQSFTTGLVFAGYGADEIFPSLRSVEIGGVLGGKLRWRGRRKVDIDRAAKTAEIIPFAQRETVDAILYGRSEKYQQRVTEHFSIRPARAA